MSGAVSWAQMVTVPPDRCNSTDSGSGPPPTPPGKPGEVERESFTNKAVVLRTMTTPLLIPARGPMLTKRFTNLMVGLVLFGVGIGMMLQSEMGVSPWDVLHQGLTNRFGLTVGIWSIIISGAVLL